MLGLLAIPLGLIAGGAIIFGMGTTGSADAQAYRRYEGQRKKDDDAVQDEALERMNAAKVEVGEARAGGKSMRLLLDVCFLAFIVIAALSIVMYESKTGTGRRFDPLLSLARAFPRETAAISQVLTRIREEWPAAWFTR